MTERTKLHEYADEIGLFFESFGLPRIAGRILGWLMVCEPAHQSAEELCAALQVSRGSVSMAIRMLQINEAVERYPVAGTRRVYYRMRPGFWLREAESKAKVQRDWRLITERGLELTHDRSDESRSRLQEARDMAAYFEQEYARIRDSWLELQKRQEKRR